MAKKKLTYIQLQDGLRTIARYLKPYRRKVIILVVVSLISALGSAVTPYLLGKFFDALLGKIGPFVILGASISPFVVLLMIWALASFMTNFAERYKGVESERINALVEGDYIVGGMNHLINSPLGFHKKHKMGEVINRVERAAGRISSIISQVIINLAPDIFSVFFAFFIVIFIDPILTLILFLGLVTFLVVIALATPKYMSVLQSVNKAYNKAYGEAYDSVINVQAVKQGTAEKFEKRKLEKNFKFGTVSYWTEYMKIYSNLTLSQRFIVTLTQLSIFVISVFFVQSGRITLGDLAAFNGYAAMIFGPFYRMGANWDLIQNGLIAMQRAEKILGIQEEQYVPKDSFVFSNPQGEVEFRSVSFQYGRGQNPVLDDITFRVPAGQIVALVGASGVGKSTLADLMSYYYKPTKGTIFIDGHDISLADLTSLRSFIAVVAQEPILFNETIKNNIKYGSFGASDEKMLTASKMAHADEFIMRLPKKYNQRVGDRGIRLSAGQKQRIAIARAILRNPRILILDEPTSALDAKNEKYITESLEKLMAGRTTFIIAHRLSTVRKADLILVLENGKIVERGTHEELIKIPDGVYKKLYELQIGLK